MSIFDSKKKSAIREACDRYGLIANSDIKTLVDSYMKNFESFIAIVENDLKKGDDPDLAEALNEFRNASKNRTEREGLAYYTLVAVFGKAAELLDMPVLDFLANEKNKPAIVATLMNVFDFTLDEAVELFESHCEYMNDV